MANYVYNKIVCKKEVLEKYFLDYIPFYENEVLDEPYITFNKILDYKIPKVGYDHHKEHGVIIYYGNGFEYNEIDNGWFEIKFETRWDYPIKPIVKVIELCKEEIIWYAVEENFIYFSKFYWKDNKVLEDTLYSETADFENWLKCYGLWDIYVYKWQAK